MYGNFAGRDASRGLAKGSFDSQHIRALDQPIDKLDDLTKEEQDALDEWAGFFSFKLSLFLIFQCALDVLNVVMSRYKKIGRLVQDASLVSDSKEE